MFKEISELSIIEDKIGTYIIIPSVDVGKAAVVDKYGNLKKNHSENCFEINEGDFVIFTYSLSKHILIDSYQILCTLGFIETSICEKNTIFIDKSSFEKEIKIKDVCKRVFDTIVIPHK